MLNSHRLQLVVLCVAFSHAACMYAGSIHGVYGMNETVATLLADNSGNPWAFPAPQEDPYDRYRSQEQPYYRGPHFITPEEQNSIYKKFKEDEQDKDPPAADSVRKRQYPTVPGFDPLMPGTVYPGVDGGMYAPYGLSPYYTPYNLNSVTPFIY